MPATSKNNLIPFPVRTGNPTTSDPGSQLLKAAKAAYSALLLAVPAGEKNTVIRTLGEAIRATEQPHPPKDPSPAAQQPRCESMRSLDGDVTGEHAVQRNSPPFPKLSEAAPAQLLHEIHSQRCVCGMAKESRRPFCRRCYFSLNDTLRAAMWFSGCDESEHLLEKVIEARAYLRRVGVLAPMAKAATA